MTASPTLPAPALEHLCDLRVTVGTPQEIGATPMGLRRVVPITGGTVSGRLSGRVLAGGADFQLIVAEGTQAHLDARYVLALDDGSTVWVQNSALRVARAEDSLRLRQGQPVDPARVYFRCQPRMETAAPAWSWLNTCQIVGVGERDPDAVRMSFYRVC